MDRRPRRRRDPVDDTDQPPAAAAPPERTDMERAQTGSSDEEPRVGAVHARDEEQPL